MRGHIVQRSKNKGTWSIKIALGKDNTGKYKYQWYTVQGSKRDAEKRLSELLHQLDTGAYITPGKATVTEYLERWLKEYAWPNLAPRTAEGYEQIVRHYFIPQLGTTVMANLKPGHLQKFYSQELDRGLNPQTVRHHHTMIHKALQDAIEWGLLVRNVAEAIKPPRAQRHEMQAWSENELSQFLEAAKDSQYYELFYLALFTGMRRSELLALRWQDIDLILGQVFVNRSLHQLRDGSYVFTQPKSAQSRRTIALSPSVVMVLKEYHDKRFIDCVMLGTTFEDTALVFSTFDGNPLRPNTITRAWTNLATRAGVKRIRLHDARHTHASIMLKQGIHPKIVQERLGHASIQITLDTYSHVAPGLQESAAKRFDDALQIRHNEAVAEKV